MSVLSYAMKSQIEKQELYVFLKEVEKDFITPLSAKVNLVDYTEKVFVLSEILCLKDKNKIVGCIIFYCNNLKEKFAYISLLVIRNEYRGRGYSTLLLKKVILFLKKRDIKMVQVHTESMIACKLYEKIGFRCIEEKYGRKKLELGLVK